MTNNEIVIKVFKEYKVSEMIKKNIDNSVNDKTYQDLEQYIYLSLLEMSNEKLLNLYKSNKLNLYIVGIVIQQRNQYRTYYNRKLKAITNYNGNTIYNIELKEDELEIQNETEYNYEFDDKIVFIEKELSLYKLDHSGLTYEEMRAGAEYFYLKEYLTTGIGRRELAKKYNINNSTLYTLLRSGKKRIRDRYKKINNGNEN